MRRQPTGNFISDDFGGGTILGLFWFMVLVAFCGLAVDITNGFRNRTMLQATADSAALAAAIDLPLENAAVATAVSYSDDNMSDDQYGSVLKPEDVTIGTWDHSTRTFFPGGAFPDSVRVQLRQTAANTNAVPVNFLRIVGLMEWEVNVQAVAQRFIPECLNDGLIAQRIVDISSNNDFVRNICIHGQKGVHMQNHNYFELGVGVSMPKYAMLTIPTGGMESNPGLPEAMREQSLIPRMVNHTNEIMDDFLNPTSVIKPSYITANSVITVDDKFDLSKTQQGNIYRVACKPNKKASIPSNSTIVGVVIIADCEVHIGANATIIDSVIGSRGGSNGKTTSANITVAAGVQLGAPDDCAPGGGVQLFSNATMHFSSTTSIDGVQMVAKGDIELGARDRGINGISAQSGNDIKLTSNNMFGLCSGNAPNLFTVPYYRLVG